VRYARFRLKMTRVITATAGLPVRAVMRYFLFLFFFFAIFFSRSLLFFIFFLARYVARFKDFRVFFSFHHAMLLRCPP